MSSGDAAVMMPNTGTPTSRRARADHRIWAAVAAGWSALYVASKIHFALDGRIGVTGGPAVPTSHYADYGPGEVAPAQWGNAAVGAAIVLLFVFCLLPVALRVNRWIVLVPLVAVVLTALLGAVGMLGRALLSDSGGAVFGCYCLVWAALGSGTLVAVRRRAGRRRAS